MEHESILRLVSELRRRHGELEGVEAKAAHTGFKWCTLACPNMDNLWTRNNCPYLFASVHQL